MSGYANAARVAAYQSASAHGGVAAADPHRLILMLMDGALERIAAARGCIERQDIVEKARLLNRAVAIIGELNGSLDLKVGGEIAANLSDLYAYMSRSLLKANVENSVMLLDEVSRLLREIRDAWAAIAPKVQVK